MEELRNIIAKMIENGEPEHVIRAIVDEWKKRNSKKVQTPEALSLQNNQVTDEQTPGQLTGALQRAPADAFGVTPSINAGPSNDFVSPLMSNVSTPDPKKEELDPFGRFKTAAALTKSATSLTKSKSTPLYEITKHKQLFSKQGFHYNKNWLGNIIVESPKGNSITLSPKDLKFGERLDQFTKQNVLNEEEIESRNLELQGLGPKITSALNTQRDIHGINPQYFLPESKGGSGTALYRDVFGGDNTYAELEKEMYESLNLQYVSRDAFSRKFKELTQQWVSRIGNEAGTQLDEDEIRLIEKERGTNMTEEEALNRLTDRTEKNIRNSLKPLLSDLARLNDGVKNATTDEEKLNATRKWKNHLNDIDWGKEFWNNGISSIVDYFKYNEVKNAFDPITGNAIDETYSQSNAITNQDLANNMLQQQAGRNSYPEMSDTEYWDMRYDGALENLAVSDLVGRTKLRFEFDKDKWLKATKDTDFIENMIEAGATFYDENGDPLTGGANNFASILSTKTSAIEVSLLQAAKYRDKLFLGKKNFGEKVESFFRTPMNLIRSRIPSVIKVDDERFDSLKDVFEYIDTYSKKRKNVVAEEKVLRQLSMYGIDPASYDVDFSLTTSVAPSSITNVLQAGAQNLKETWNKMDHNLDQYSNESVIHLQEETLNYLNDSGIKISDEQKEKLGKSLFYEYGYETPINFSETLAKFMAIEVVLNKGGSLLKIPQYLNKFSKNTKFLKGYPMLSTATRKTAPFLYGVAKEEAKMWGAFEENYHMGGGATFFALGSLAKKYMPLKLTHQPWLNTVIGLPRDGVVFATSAKTAEIIENGIQSLQGYESIKMHLEETYPSGIFGEEWMRSFYGDIIFGKMLGLKTSMMTKGSWWTEKKFDDIRTDNAKQITRVTEQIEHFESQKDSAFKGNNVQGRQGGAKTKPTRGGDNFAKNEIIDKQIKKLENKLHELLNIRNHLEGFAGELYDIRALDSKDPKVVEKYLKKRHGTQVKQLEKITGKKAEWVIINGREGVDKNGDPIKFKRNDSSAEIIDSKDGKKVYVLTDVSKKQHGKIEHEVGHAIFMREFLNTTTAKARFVQIIEDSMKGRYLLNPDAKDEEPRYGSIRDFITENYAEELASIKGKGEKQKRKELTDDEFIGYTFELLADKHNYWKLVKENKKGLSNWTMIKEGLKKQSEEYGWPMKFDGKMGKADMALFIGRLAQSVRGGNVSSLQLRKLENILEEPLLNEPVGSSSRKAINLEVVKLNHSAKPRASKDLNEFTSEMQRLWEKKGYVTFGGQKLASNEIDNNTRDWLLTHMYDPRMIKDKNNVLYDPNRRELPAGARMVGNALSKHRERPGFKIYEDQIIEEILTGLDNRGRKGRSILDIIKAYDPKKNDSLTAYVTEIGFSGRFRNVVADAVNKYLGKGEEARGFDRPVEDSDLAGIKDPSDKTGEDIKVKPTKPKQQEKTIDTTPGMKELSKPLKKVETAELSVSKEGVIETKDPLPNTSRVEVEKWLPKVDFNKEGSLKTVESRVEQGINKIFGVEAKPGHLSVKSVKNALKKIDKLAPVIEKIMPEGYIPLKGIKDLFGKEYKPSEIIKGKGMGLRKTFPDLYEKGSIKGDLISEKTGRVKTAAGVDPRRKIENTNGKVIRDMFRIDELKNKDGSFNVNTAVVRELSGKIKGVIKWIDKIKTSQVIRSNKDLIKVPDTKSKFKFTVENVVADLAAGKDKSLSSKELKTEVKILMDNIMRPSSGKFVPIKTTSDFIDYINNSNLSKEHKKMLIDEIASVPKMVVESREFQAQYVEDMRTAEFIDVALSDATRWDALEKNLKVRFPNLKVNKTGIIEGEAAYQRKKDHDISILKSLPRFETLPEKVQAYILDQFGVGYIKFKTDKYTEYYNQYIKGTKPNATAAEQATAKAVKQFVYFKSVENKKTGKKENVPQSDYFRLTKTRGNHVDTVRRIYGEDALKGNGKEYKINKRTGKGELDAAHWQRTMSQKDLTKRGIDLNLKSVKKGKSPEIKDIIADLAELHKLKEITTRQYWDYARKILKHENYTFEETYKANQALIKTILKPFYSQYKKAKNKDQALSDIINHLKPLTNIATSISKGFYTITSVPFDVGKPVKERGRDVRTHNEHELQLFNFNEFLIDIITKSKNQTEFNNKLDRLVSMGEQSIIPKWLQKFNDSTERGGPAGIGKFFTGDLSGFAKSIFMTKKGVGDNQLYLLGDKPMTLNEFIVDNVKLNRIKNILKTFKPNERTVESVNLEKLAENPPGKVKKYNESKFKDKVYSSKEMSNTELTEIIEKRAKAILNARDVNAPKRGASILDFDDTVGKTKSKIKYEIPRHLPDGRFNPAVVGWGAIPSKGKLTPAEYAIHADKLSKYGATFDYSEFNKIVDGKKGPLFDKLVKIQEKYGTENTFILTARPAGAEQHIQKFLKELGVDIPLRNIRGLEDGRPGAKANFIVDRAAEGYNDFYFVDDAIQNVKAVKNIVNVLGVNGKIRQTVVKASKNLSTEFNEILKETKGVDVWKKFSKGAAKTRGSGKGKWTWWLPHSAGGFLDLMYPTFGKGKTGEKHMKWFDEKLGRPYARGFYELNKEKQRIHDDYEALKKQYPEIKKIINKDSGYNKFNNDAAIRVYLWEKNGMEIPELSKTDIKALVKVVKSNPELQSYADKLSKITQIKEGYVEPGESWLAKSIQHDLLDISNNIGRKQFFKEWIDNKNVIFSEENMNKLEAIYGTRYRSALEDMLYRMEFGRNKQRNTKEYGSQFNTWIANATGTVMFMNRRSALTQTISMLNFTNWSDNNPLKIAKAFANQPQFWKDFSMIWNSPMLKQRRKGLTMDVNYEEIVNTISGKKDKVSAAVAYMLNKGFILTKVADNFAIAFGGSSFYRNRLNSYLKQGLNKKQAEEKAFLDFQEASEPTQQSSRPDLISQQQASPLGRFLLTFQNVTMQNNRNGKRAVLDLINNRGDHKTNISKILYYYGVQNMIFLGMQQALFAAYWDPDAKDEDRSKKQLKIANGMLDTLLRGSGMFGVGASTIKNTLLKYAEEREKGWKGSEAKVLIEALNISPPVGSKARKLHSAMLEAKFNDDSILKPTLLATEGFTNIPFHEFLEAIESGVALTNDELEAWQKVAIALGYPEWQVNYEPVKPPKVKNPLKRKMKKSIDIL